MIVGRIIFLKISSYISLFETFTVKDLKEVKEHILFKVNQKSTLTISRSSSGHDSLWTTLLQFEALTGIGVVQRREGSRRCRVRLSAVRRQRSRDVARARVEGRRSGWRGVQGPVQCLQQRHDFVAGRNVLWHLCTGEGHRRCNFTRVRCSVCYFVFCSVLSPVLPSALLSLRSVRWWRG